MVQCGATRLVIPDTTRRIPKNQALEVIERVLNSQRRNDIANIFVSSAFYKVGILKNININNYNSNYHYSSSYVRSQQVYYNQIGDLKLLEYPNHYNLLVINHAGKEINKVICYNLYDIYWFIDAIRNLKGQVKNTKPPQPVITTPPQPDITKPPNDSTNISLQLGVGIYYSQENDYSNAILSYKKVLEQDSVNITALSNLGYCYISTGDYLLAITNFKKCIELKSDYFDSYLGCAIAYYYQNNLPEALNYINLAKEVQPVLKEGVKGLEKLKSRGFFYSKEDDAALNKMLQE